MKGMSTVGLKPRKRAVICVAASAGIGLLIWSISANRGTVDQEDIWRLFRRVALSLENYSVTYNSLPPPIIWKSEPASPPHKSRQAYHSWRSMILRSLANVDYDSTYRVQPWNSESNRAFADAFVYPPYSYPSGKRLAHRHTPEEDETRVLAITGAGTAFGDGQEPPKALRDVSPSTIIAVETRSSGIHWMKPGDFDISTMPNMINAPDGKGISSECAGGFFVVFADAEVWRISNAVPFATLRRFFLVEEAKKLDRETVLKPYVIYVSPTR